MPAQRCVGRDAKDAIETVGPIAELRDSNNSCRRPAGFPGQLARIARSRWPLFQLETDCTPSAQHQ